MLREFFAQQLARRMRDGYGAIVPHLRLLRREVSALLSASFRLDAASAVVCVVFLIATVPLVPRATGEARLLAAFVNDEPPLTMALEAMTVPPYGNPANFYREPAPGRPGPPDHWGSIAYTGGYFYYGGAYFMPAFAVFAPLHWLGMPTFPAAPMILRTISLLAGLLSLLALYNLAKPHAGVLGALVPVSFLFLDGSFLYYSTIIHPDTLQLLLGLLVVGSAARHCAAGGVHSLAVLGVLCGLIQGTKFGGPWTVPLGLVAAHWGLRAAFPIGGNTLVFYRQFAWRLLLLGAVALTAYFVSTPYAVLDRYYFRTLRAVYSTITAANPFESATFIRWAADLHLALGTPLSAIGAIALLWGLLQLRGRRDQPVLGLAALTSVSQGLWYATQSKVWVSLGYLMLSLALAAFLAILLARILLSRAPRRLTQGVFLFALIALVESRAYSAVSYILRQHLLHCSTAVEIDRWARAGGIPAGSAIVHDDTAYFDRGAYPQAHMHGGILTWRAMRSYGAEYVVLSGTLLGAPHMSKLIASQNMTREDSSQWSVRLYQDLLPLAEPGTATADGLFELLKRIRPTAAEPAAFCSASSSEKLAPERWRVPGWFKSSLPSLAAQGEDFAYLAGNITGARNDLSGAELRVYRYLGPRILPITDGTLAGYSAKIPFGSGGGAWVSHRSGEAAVGSYIGADFGARPRAFREITVRWVLPYSTPLKARLEYSEDGKIWTETPVFPVRLPADSAAYSQTTRIDVAQYGAHRYWRLVAVEMVERGSFAVSGLDFLE